MKPTAGPGAPIDRSKVKIALVAPRNMRFAPHSATSIDLHIHECARWSRFRENIVVFAEEIENPFDDVAVRFWPKGRPKGNLERLVAAEAPDLIVAHQHLPTAARLAGRFRDIPTVLVRHNFQRPPRNMISGYFKRRSFNSLNAIAFVSERCREQFETDWPGVTPPRFVTPNGVDSRIWQPAAEKERIILFVGRLAPEKGVLEAAVGIERALQTREGWQGVFVLSDPDAQGGYADKVRAALKRMGPKAKVIKNVPHEEVRHWMSVSAIAVMPTQGDEPFGRVAAEAMASGAALITSSGLIEAVGDSGVILSTPNGDNIAKALGELLDDPDLRRSYSDAARQRVENRWDLSRSVLAFDQLAETLLSGTTVAPPLDLATALK